MAIPASELPEELVRLLDQVLESGEPVEIERNGRVLRLAIAPTESKLSRLIKRPGFIRGDPDDLVHMDWSSEWKP